MKRFTGSVIAAVAAVGAMLSAAPAQAAPADMFLAHARAAGFTNSGGNMAMLADGNLVCAHFHSGYSGPQVITAVYYRDNMDQYDASRFVAIAVSDLCPMFLA